jgi:repressor LexA
MGGEAEAMNQTPTREQEPPPVLTTRQLEVYGLILEGMRRHGRAPTIRALQARLQLASPNGVVCHLLALEKKGLLRRERKKAWGWRLAGVSWQPSFDDSLAGQIARRAWEALGGSDLRL